METVSSGKTVEKHPFGELLTQYRRRKAGLTQSHLAELAGYDQAILVRMCQGKKDLTGPSGRERVVRLIETLATEGALTVLDEANALLLAADMPPLFERQPSEARLMTRLSHLPPGHRQRRTNLPAPLTSFIGRALEVAEVRRLLNTTRLLTLTGAGGSGKTRLAQRVAADVLLHYSEGVWYAELATLTDSTLIPDLVARALGLVVSNRPTQELVLDYLRERHILLVLDNCEHLIDGVAEFAVALLHACPRVTILTTSREALNVDGEALWRVPPMQPDEAGQLFVERAVAVRSEAPLSARDKTIAHICQRLDGMPLAIELAAARLQSLGLSDIAARLDDRFSLLTGGRRGALPRHQTLRALIDWSYDALSEPEKSVFRRLGVFVGGWELEQAEQVVSDTVNLAKGAQDSSSSVIIRPADVLPLLTQLVSKSLVLLETREDVTRYRYLETIREHALEKLTVAGENEAARHTYAKAYMQLAERSVQWLHGPQQRAWLSRMQRDYANLQAAMGWCFESGGAAVTGCRIAGALFHYWYIASGHHNDAQKWTRLAKTALTQDMPPSVQAWVLLDEEWFCGDIDTAEERGQRIYDLFVQAGDAIRAVVAKWVIARAVFYAKRDYPVALRLHEECVNEARALGADWELRFSLEGLGECLRFAQHDPTRAEATYREAMALAKAADDTDTYARDLGYYISGFAMERLQFEESMSYAEEALVLAQQLDDAQTAHHMRCVIAQNLQYLGRTEAAINLLASCEAFALEQMHIHSRIVPKVIRAKIALAQHEYEHAHALLAESLHMRLATARPGEFLRGAHNIVDAMSALAAAEGQALRAAHLRGIADGMFAMNHHYRWANLEWEFAPYIAQARADLGEAAYAAAYAEGRAMTPEQAIAYALSLGDVSPGNEEIKKTSD